MYLPRDILTLKVVRLKPVSQCSHSSQSSLYLYLQQKMFAEKRFSQSEKQIEEILQIHTHLISKKVFANNWTK